MSQPKRLYRSRTNRIFGGVCAGLADYFNADPTIIRIIFVVVSALPGPSVIFYLIAWLIIPLEPVHHHRPTKVIDAE